MRTGLRTALGIGVFSLACLAAEPVHASPRVWTPEGEHVGIDQQREARLVALARAHAGRLGIAGLRGIKLRAEARASVAGPDLEIWRVLGSLDGVPLAEPVAHALVDLSRGGEVLLWTHGERVGPLLDGAAVLGEGEALARLRASGLAGREGARGGVLVAVAGWPHSRLAWQIAPPPDLEGLAHRVFHVDAVTGRVVIGREKLRFANVNAFPVNPVATPESEVFALEEIDAMPSFLDGPRFRARNCLMPNSGNGNCVPTQVAAPDMNGDFLFPPPTIGDPQMETIAGEAFSEGALYFHADRLFAWLDTLGFPGLVCHEMAQTAMLTANYASWSGGQLQPFENAFYTGDCSATVYMGQGEHDTAWDGDIIYHELGHGVVDRQTFGGLGEERRRPHGVSDDAGAINEGFADYLSGVFTDDPVGFEYGLPDYSRDADNDMWCARDMVGELHADGELFSGAMWEVHQQLGEPFMVAVIDGLSMVDVDASFEEITAAILAATEAEMGADARDQAAAILDARGMVDCSRLVDAVEFGAGGVHAPLPERSFILWPPEWFNTYDPVRPGPFEFFVELPDGIDTVDVAYQVLVAFDTEPAVGADLGIVFRRNDPITFTYEEKTLGHFGVMADSEGFIGEAENGAFQLTGAPGDVIYFSFVHLGGPAPGEFADPAVTIAELEVDFSGPPPPDDTGTDSGTDTGEADSGGTESETGGEPGAASDPSGCGCTTTNVPSRAPWALAASVLLLGTRRRRRA